MIRKVIKIFTHGQRSLELKLWHHCLMKPERISSRLLENQPKFIQLPFKKGHWMTVAPKAIQKGPGVL